MPSYDTEVPVLLVRLDPNPFHHGTLGAVRSLGRAGVEVHVAVASDSRTGRPLPVSAPRASPPPRRRLSRGPRTRAAAHLGRDRPALRAHRAGRRSAIAVAARSAAGGPVPAAGHARRSAGRLADKAELAALCERAGIAHPTTTGTREPGRGGRTRPAAWACPSSRSGAAPGCCPAGRACAARSYGRPRGGPRAVRRRRRRAADCSCSAFLPPEAAAPTGSSTATRPAGTSACGGAGRKRTPGRVVRG